MTGIVAVETVSLEDKTLAVSSLDICRHLDSASTTPVVTEIMTEVDAAEQEISVGPFFPAYCYEELTIEYNKCTDATFASCTDDWDPSDKLLKEEKKNGIGHFTYVSTDNDDYGDHYFELKMSHQDAQSDVFVAQIHLLVDANTPPLVDPNTPPFFVTDPPTVLDNIFQYSDWTTYTLPATSDAEGDPVTVTALKIASAGWVGYDAANNQVRYKADCSPC